jgi:hypothetical protein
MRLTPITIQPPKIRLTEEEILADLVYPATPEQPGVAAAGR